MKTSMRPQSDREPWHSPAAHAILQPRAGAGFVDHRPETIAQLQLAEAIHTSPVMVAQHQQLGRMFGPAVQLKGSEDEELQMKAAPAVLQRKGPEKEELLQGKFQPAQCQASEDEEPLQGKFQRGMPAQLKEETPRLNHTGLPNNLKSGIESLSGMSMDNVRVHHNSSQPAQLNALAYAQGTDIHVAPGQEQHPPHEAWHVVQQAQGRVQPTMQMQDGVPVNDDMGLEHEADVMGAKAMQMQSPALRATGSPHQRASSLQLVSGTPGETNGVGNCVGAAAEEVPLNFFSVVPLTVRGRPALMGGSQRVGGSDEERPINTPNLRAGLADRLFMPPIVSRLTANAPVQRLVVNTGEDSFHDEVSGERGWIVAKDIDVALQHGGVGQKIVEADALGTADPIGGSENIYLEGHGSPDFLGDKDPEDVADALRPVLPDPYVGTIYSLSCSAGVASEPDSFSGIEMLARELGLATRMEGAAGVALNHPALPGSHRAIRSGNFDAADLIIDKKITGYDINRMWSDYIEKVWTGSLPLAAAVATDMTEAFYVDVAETLDTLGYLLPTNADTMVVEDAEGYGEIGEGSLEHEDQAPDTSNPFSVLVRGKD